MSESDPIASAPFRSPRYRERRVEVERRADGSVVMRNPHPLRPRAAHLVEPIRQYAEHVPDRVWLGVRDGAMKSEAEPFGPWQLLTYADAKHKLDAIAQALLDRGLDQSKPIMILSGNSIEHALMTYGAMQAGVPVAPVSPSYSTMSSDFEKLKYVFGLVEPRLLFVQQGAPFERAFEALKAEFAEMASVEIVSVDGSVGTPFASLLETRPTGAVEEAVDRLHDDLIAKYMFTSGSTGMPKAVIMTSRMMCLNAVMPRSTLEEIEDEIPPVLLNWLPWNHVYGANAILNNLTVSGGTLYIDGGRPVGAAFAETVQNLREIAPTAYSSVPAGYTMLVEELERDRALAETFFSRLTQLNYGGAAMSQHLYDRIQKVAVEVTGERIVFSSGYGSTETAPTIMNVHWPTERTGLIGLPLPGVEIKLAPLGNKLEVRARGECITPGYHKNPERSAEAFDEEGFYRLGDGARFVNPEAPEEGLVFDGRVAEDFKLESGTWVSAGKLRVQAIASAHGLLQDALIAGLDRSYVGLLGFPNFQACRDFLGEDLTEEDLVRHPRILERLAEGLRQHNQAYPASSTRIGRALLMVEPASVDAGELTDKGYINQGVALGRRANLVEKLYAEPPGNDVVVP